MNRILRLYDMVTTRVLDRLRDPLLLALRLFIGWQFFVTGKGKLASIDNVVAFFTHLGLPMPGLTAHFVAWVELLGGALLFVGLFTRLTALVLTVNMAVAYLTADLTAVKVTMDHEVLSSALDGTALPIDPGIHTFTFEAAGQRPVTKSLVQGHGPAPRLSRATRLATRRARSSPGCPRPPAAR